MSAGAYSKVGAKGVARGLAYIPIIPESKRPGELKGGQWIGMVNWRAEFTSRLPSKEEVERWSASDAGVCVVTGPASRDVVGVDIDTDDDPVKSAIIGVIPKSPCIKRGEKGETHFFCGPKIEKSKSWNADGAEGKKVRVCDLLGPGRQSVLPETIHPDTGKPYEWIGEWALEDTPPEELPELTPEHVAAIDVALAPFGCNKGFGEREAKPNFDGDDSDKPFRQLNNAAMANFDAWVPQLGLRRYRRTHVGYEAVAEWRASSSGQDFSKRKFNLKFHPDGIKDFGDGPKPYTPINVVIAARGFGSTEDRAARSQAYLWLPNNSA